MSNTVKTEMWYPEHIKSIDEYKSIITGYDKELALAYDDRDVILGNRYISTMDADECARWEAMLGISVSAGATLAERRLEIRSMWLSGLPYTPLKLDEVLNGICGADRYILEINKAEKDVVVTLKLSVITKTDYIYKLVRQMIPADMTLEVNILFNRWSAFAGRTWRELMSSTWQSIYSDESWSS